ncbi:hypothetical protein F444_00273 [Phytophthora nicotianae P1976]|uniref:Uncharacterized protein n=1 Tax=Phytophthora nicotianae P1976 TaxID=1317066 RepID=A0A081B4T8_PHYNI|nr:hypothetical protein F444_00273 [Phytophthora nicotianae P1976]
MECVIENRGNNSYKRQHKRKAKLRKVYLLGPAYHFLTAQQAVEKEEQLRLQLEAIRMMSNE